MTLFPAPSLRCLLVASLCLAGCAAQAPAPPAPGLDLAPSPPREPLPPAEGPDVTAMVGRALPAVVLVLGERDGGKIGYGAGLLVSKDGRILTNHHVIEGATKLGVMLYSPKRLSYTPMDGGLDRYIFENAGDILPVSVQRQDPVGDLAILKGAFDASFAPILPVSRLPPRPGERVYALGHPQETVWSFTAGTVSAIHVGAIQHDAVVSRGSSGGPLLNARGEVIGINTARIVSEARGFAFARPIAMADRFLDRPTGGRDLDRSTPEVAMFSCWHAMELEMVSAKACYDPRALWTVFVEAALDNVRRPRPGVRADALRKLSDFIQRPDALERVQNEAQTDRAWVQSSFGAPPFFQFEVLALRAAGLAGPGDPLERVTPELQEVTEARAILRRRLVEAGVQIDPLVKDPRAARELLRKGGRIERTKPVGADRVWFWMLGRNLDGSPYRYAELWVKAAGQWYQREPPLPDDLAELPPGWPPPVRALEPLRHAIAAEIATRLGAQRSPHAPRARSQSVEILDLGSE